MPDATHQGRAGRQWHAALLTLCLAVFWVQCTHIARTLPYPRDIDEGFVSGPASRTLTTGTFHPYRFNYPSLPKYLAAAGMGAGFLSAASHLEISEIQKLGSVGYPYYDTPRALRTARQLFALLSIVALMATAIIAWQLLQVPPAIVLAPLLVVMAPLFFYHSWTYLNVDIVAFCFSTLTLAACAIATRRPGIAQAAIIPAVCAGLATGSKYTMAVVIVPVLVTIALYVSPGRRLWAALAALAAMVVAFVAVVPYSLIDLPGFLNGIAVEAFHYANGHPGFDGEPGLPQAWFYLRQLVRELGPVALVMAAIGAVVIAIDDWKRAAVLVAFPLTLGVLLIGQRVHFERNLIGIYPVVATLAVAGALATRGWFEGKLQGRPAFGRRLRHGGAALMVVILIPWWHLPDVVRDRTDSRNAATQWIEDKLPPGTTVVVPRQLSFDTRPLEARGTHVVGVDLQAAVSVDAFQQLLQQAGGPALLLLPRWAADDRFEGKEVAARLNEIGRMLKPIVRFGSNPVLVNYTEPVPWGDPEFGLAPIGGLTLTP